MLIADTVADLRTELAAFRSSGSRIGLVPTMGALHEGHESLIARCVRECVVSVVSIYVNPIQFGPAEDFAAYPRDLAADLARCRHRGVSIVFTPSDREMYGDGTLTRVSVDQLTQRLCGKSRPGHFDGVCTVVCKLFAIVQPDAAYFGEKDFQQLVVVRRMVQDLSLPVEVIGCPTVREPDGLALSSRNAYLNAEERRRAPAIHDALLAGAERVHGGECTAAAVTAFVAERLRGNVDSLEYVEIVDPRSLAPVDQITGPARLCVAARIGRTRLIDNIAVDARRPRH